MEGRSSLRMVTGVLGAPNSWYAMAKAKVSAGLIFTALPPHHRSDREAALVYAWAASLEIQTQRQGELAWLHEAPIPTAR